MQNSKLFIYKNASENIVCEMAAIWNLSHTSWIGTKLFFYFFDTHLNPSLHVTVQFGDIVISAEQNDKYFACNVKR